jgi:predicted Na+-dependent transporter
MSIRMLYNCLKMSAENFGQLSRRWRDHAVGSLMPIGAVAFEINSPKADISHNKWKMSFRMLYKFPKTSAQKFIQLSRRWRDHAIGSLMPIGTVAFLKKTPQNLDMSENK